MHNISLTLYGCATAGGTVTATLLLADDSEVISATQYVTVQPDLSPKVELPESSFFGIYKVGAWHGPFTVSASNLDSNKSYMIKLTITDKAPDMKQDRNQLRCRLLAPGEGLNCAGRLHFAYWSS